MKWYFLLLMKKINGQSVLTFGACLPLNLNGGVHDRVGTAEALSQTLMLTGKAFYNRASQRKVSSTSGGWTSD